jgi:voltage-gated potassium channel
VNRVPRRALAAAVVRTCAGAAVLFLVFAFAPLELRLDGAPGVWLAASVLVPALVLTLQIVAVARSPYPMIRAVEGVSLSFPLLIFLFAATYYAMDQTYPHSFNQVLTRTDALYFTVTTFTTVGFGDIVATSQSSRIAVTVQMLADLVLIGVIARVLLGTIQKRRATLELGGGVRQDVDSEQPRRP